MRNLEKRVRRIEALVENDEGLTLEDVELILSCTPKDLADTIMKELSEFAEQEFKGVDDRHLALLCGNRRSGLYGKTLELIMNSLPPDCATELKAKLAAREI